MDNRNLILVSLLAFILLLMYEAWQEDYGDKKAPAASAPQEQTEKTESLPAPAEAEPEFAAGEEEIPPQLAEKSSDIPKASAEGEPAKRHSIKTERRIKVKTDLMQVEIDTMGGDIRQVELLKYPVAVDKPDEPFRLMNDEMPHLFIFQSGLQPAPSHKAIYNAKKSVYRLEADEDELKVSLFWQGSNGMQVTKELLFYRGSYVINVQYLVENTGKMTWKGRMYAQLQRAQIEDEGSHMLPTYTGAAIASPETRYEKIAFDDMPDNFAPLTRENRKEWAGGWAAMLQHYFVAAIVPESVNPYRYYTLVPSTNRTRYAIGLRNPPRTVVIAPGQQEMLALKLYIGPKLQDKLAELAPDLELTVDYGILWFLSQPLFWLLKAIYNMFGNWGVAIILVTLIIKLAFFHLSATSYKSMANMRRMQPRMQALKERYGDDRTKLNQAMMTLYKKEKINPLGGCLPILVQIPVFIALYWVLLESVELRQADFMWWLNDLSSADPYFVLPLLMGATMLFQQHLNPAPIDPIQQKVMYALPVIFTIFFAFFPSGLVLYWVVNNTLSIAQQWAITKKITGENLLIKKKK
ncbi:MAG: membrane protein insertase YidC [Gammaproteobacteria bacterium]|nr:membrane protein insertase YidC [Gammaproteobacteria bacterium]